LACRDEIAKVCEDVGILPVPSGELRALLGIEDADMQVDFEAFKRLAGVQSNIRGISKGPLGASSRNINLESPRPSLSSPVRAPRMSRTTHFMEPGSDSGEEEQEEEEGQNAPLNRMVRPLSSNILDDVMPSHHRKLDRRWEQSLVRRDHQVEFEEVEEAMDALWMGSELGMLTTSMRASSPIRSMSSSRDTSFANATP